MSNNQCKQHRYIPSWTENGIKISAIKYITTCTIFISVLTRWQMTSAAVVQWRTWYNELSWVGFLLTNTMFNRFCDDNNNNNNNNNNRLVIHRTMVMVLSSWHKRTSSPGSSNECTTLPSGCRPSDQAKRYIHHRHGWRQTRGSETRRSDTPGAGAGKGQ